MSEKTYGGHTEAELAALDKAATPGEWHMNAMSATDESEALCAGDDSIAVLSEFHQAAKQVWSNYELIVAARNALPDLLAEIARLREENSDLRQQAVAIAKGCTDYGGGYRADEAKLKIYHHGMDTVARALADWAERGLAGTQTRVVHAIGKAMEGSES